MFELFDITTTLRLECKIILVFFSHLQVNPCDSFSSIFSSKKKKKALWFSVLTLLFSFFCLIHLKWVKIQNSGGRRWKHGGATSRRVPPLIDANSVVASALAESPFTRRGNARVHAAANCTGISNNVRASLHLPLHLSWCDCHLSQ